jgi:hypothetical protein
MATGARGQGLRQGDHSPAGWRSSWRAGGGGHIRFVRQRRPVSPKAIPVSVGASRTYPRCIRRKAILQEHGRSKSARWRSARRCSAPSTPIRHRVSTTSPASGPKHPWTKDSTRLTADALVALDRVAEAAALRARYSIKSDPPRQGNDPYGSRRQPLSVGSELSSLFEALVAATRLRLDLATLPSRLQVRNWHIGSVVAVQRHVRGWGQTGSNQHIAKVTRLTHVRHRPRRRFRPGYLWAEKTYFVEFLAKHGGLPRQLFHRHQWLREMVAHRIADPIILEVIGKWLKVGAMVDGSLSKKIRNSIAGGKIVTKGPCSLEIASVSRRSAPARSRAAPA